MTLRHTLIHRTLWPELVAIGSASEPWQTQRLSEGARSLLERTREQGTLRLDRMEPEVAKVKPGDAARELQARLLVYSKELHTESGKHTKELQSWPALRARLHLPSGLPGAEDAKRTFESLSCHARDLVPGGRSTLGSDSKLLPW
jgi:hypothetical protein